MKRKIILVLTIVVIVFSFVRCGSNEHSEDDGHDHGAEEKENIVSEEEDHDSEEIIFTKEQAKNVGLIVEIVEPSIFNQVIKVSGQVLAAQGDEVTIVANSSGILSFSNASITDGVSIRKGESIVSISAKNIVDGDPVAKAKIEYEAAKIEFQRAESLVKDKIISVKEFQQASTRYNTAKAIYSGIAQKIDANGVIVTSPIDGFLKSKLVNQGEYVSMGQPIAIISQNKRLLLRAEVPEKYFGELQNVSTANFKLPYSKRLYKLSELQGKLLSYGRSSSESSFYVPIIFEFKNTGDIITGSFSEIYLLSFPQENVISIPQSALTEEQGLYFVYLQLDEEGYKKQEVILGQSNGERVQILSGLKSNDRVVTKGTYQVKLAANSSVVPEGHTH